MDKEILNWKDLEYWQSGEYQVVEERLRDLDKAGKRYTPKRSLVFSALRRISPGDVKCVILGQDPYPNPKHATGLAFSIPQEEKNIPPTLENILKEYQNDLHYPAPSSGNLSQWCSNGVLLWNVIPTCGGTPLSHDWVEYTYLTQEIIETLNKNSVVFVLLGNLSKRYLKYILAPSVALTYSHPSPRNNYNKNLKNPFLGSRLFTTVNDTLVRLNKEPVDWRLP